MLRTRYGRALPGRASSWSPPAAVEILLPLPWVVPSMPCSSAATREAGSLGLGLLLAVLVINAADVGRVGPQAVRIGGSCRMRLHVVGLDGGQRAHRHVGDRHAYLRLAVVVEPFRDDLVRLVVDGTLARTMLRVEPADSGVERLGGYAADLGPTALSAGERQLITLVRAYLAPASVIVLDEAVSPRPGRRSAR